LGIADQQLAIDVLDGRSDRLDVASMSHPAAAALDRHARAPRPVAASVTVDRPLAIVGMNASAVAHGIHLQLTRRQRARLLTVSADEAGRLRGAGRPMIVLAADLDEVPSWCVGVLDVGETWHGTWQPDVIDRPDEIIRLHVAGASDCRTTTPVNVALSPDIGVERDMNAGRAAASGADVGGAFVAEQVSRAGAELGGDVARVPQSAR
jgi:hypothetical protein